MFNFLLQNIFNNKRKSHANTWVCSNFSLNIDNYFSQLYWPRRRPATGWCWLLDTTSFICVIGSVIGGALVAYGSELRTAFKANPSQEEAMTAINVYKLAVRVSIGSGFIGTQLGWIAMLGSMDGTGMDRSALTGGAATSLITILYGLTFAFCLFLPLQYYFQSKLDKDS